MPRMIRYVQQFRFDRDRVDSKKVAVKEAIPYQEIQQNPFTVLCTTRLGGHLGWFESGTGRWFAKPVGDLRSLS